MPEPGRDGDVLFLEPIQQTNDLTEKAEDGKDCSERDIVEGTLSRSSVSTLTS